MPIHFAYRVYTLERAILFSYILWIFFFESNKAIKLETFRFSWFIANASDEGKKKSTRTIERKPQRMRIFSLSGSQFLIVAVLSNCRRLVRGQCFRWPLR